MGSGRYGIESLRSVTFAGAMLTLTAGDSGPLRFTGSMCSQHARKLIKGINTNRAENQF